MGKKKMKIIIIKEVRAAFGMLKLTWNCKINTKAFNILHVCDPSNIGSLAQSLKKVSARSMGASKPLFVGLWVVSLLGMCLFNMKALIPSSKVLSSMSIDITIFWTTCHVHTRYSRRVKLKYVKIYACNYILHI